MKSFRGILLAATAAAMLAATLPAPADSGGIIRNGPAPDVALLYTGDVIGYLDPCG